MEVPYGFAWGYKAYIETRVLKQSDRCLEVREKKICAEVPNLTEMASKEIELDGTREKFSAIPNRQKNMIHSAGSLIPHRVDSTM